MAMMRRDYTQNLDVHLARFMDDSLTYYNLHRTKRNTKIEEQEWEKKLLFMRDSFRQYWLSVEATWEGFEVEDEEDVDNDLREACAMLGEVWGDLWW